MVVTVTCDTHATARLAVTDSTNTDPSGSGSGLGQSAQDIELFSDIGNTDRENYQRYWDGRPDGNPAEDDEKRGFLMRPKFDALLRQEPSTNHLMAVSAPRVIRIV